MISMSIGRDRAPFRARGAAAGWIEWLLALLVCLSLPLVAVFISRHGYLPTPFYAAKYDNFMDWFETAWWSRHPGYAYTVWRSVYPPLSFLLARAGTRAACYAGTPFGARACDLPSLSILGACWALGAAAAFLAIKRAGVSTAAPRTLALCLGSSMLYAIDRGNLVMIAWPLWVVGMSGLAPARWARIVTMAVVLNLKPYLIIVAITQGLRRRWAWVMGVGVIAGAIYLTSWLVFGAGSPLELLEAMIAPLQLPTKPGLDLIEFAASYDSLLVLLFAGGAGPLHLEGLAMQGLRVVVFAVWAAGFVAAWVCGFWAARRPEALTAPRLAAVGLAVLFSICTPGGYAVMFLLFLVFLEPWQGLARPLAILAAFIWCVPVDLSIATVANHPAWSFISGRMVSQVDSLTVGEFVRPLLIFTIEFALIATSVADLRRAGAKRSAGDRSPPEPRRHGLLSACLHELTAMHAWED
jgi:hypothetical protein